MAAELAAKLPEVETYRGVGVDDPTTVVRFDSTPAGFHAMIRSTAGTIFIDPYSRGETDIHISYDTRDYGRPEGKTFECRVGSKDLSRGTVLASVPTPVPGATTPVLAVATNGTMLRQIRLAVAATGEYTTFYGSKAAAQAGIVTTINRVDVVYEHDLAIRMNLVDNTAIVFTDPGTDPYSNNCNDLELAANQTTIDNALGATNYDLGHVMGGPGGGGGLAGPGPCLINVFSPPQNTHAQGCTGTTAPIGDPFDIDFVSHQIGHQWGAQHTFNSMEGSCAGGSRNSATSYEPGSGSTIMAYAGVCPPDDLQLNSDDYFHGESLQTIAGYDPTAFGATDCIQMTASGNTPPTANAGADYTIPKNTPFTLCGTGTDPDVGDALTYLWEEDDLGTDPGGPANDPLSAPFFRSFDPTTSNCRTFPQLSDILNGTQTNGEILPNTAWPMTFRLTVFDNHPGAFGGGFDQDENSVTVTGVAGPFRVTAQDSVAGVAGPFRVTRAPNWTVGTNQTVTWNIAGTAPPPVSCANVDILFSDDGGASFPTTLFAATPNDGTQQVTVPDLPTTIARLKVKCSDNIFFDINNVDFTVIRPPLPCPPPFPQVLDLSTQQVGTKIYRACETITAKSGFSMAPGANVTLVAGEKVIFENGSSAGNQLTVEIAAFPP